MTLLERVRQLCQTANPAYHFEFEAEKMMNVRADDQTFPCAFFEEYTDGKYINRFGWKKSVSVELSFMRLAPMECNASTREAIREQIESEIVLPFIAVVNNSQYFDEVKEFSCVAEPPRFDANAVSVMLRFWVTFNPCDL